MKKYKINSSNDRLLEKIVYNTLLFLVNFFIDLGEATKFLLFIPIKIIIEIYKYKVFHIRSFVYGFLLALVFVFISNSYNFIKSLPSPENIGKINYSLTT